MAPSSATQLAKARAPFCACQARQQRSRTQSCTGAFLRLPGTAATQLAKARAPFCACQSRQQRSRTQSCTGAFLRLPGKAATQQNAVAHGLLVLLARGGSNTLGKHGGHPARRASSPAVIEHDGTVRRKSWPSRGYPVLWHRPLGFQPVCQCVCLGISVWVSSNVITTILSLGGLSVCLFLLANVITACRLGQPGSQCDHSLPSWGYPVFAAVCLTGEAGVGQHGSTVQH